MSRKLIDIGNSMQNIGYIWVPISFISYFILRILELHRQTSQHKSKLTKAIWYLTLGIGSVARDIRINQLVVMMIFFDSFDSFIDYFIESKQRKERQKK